MDLMLTVHLSKISQVSALASVWLDGKKIWKNILGSPRCVKETSLITTCFQKMWTRWKQTCFTLDIYKLCVSIATKKMVSRPTEKVLRITWCSAHGKTQTCKAISGVADQQDADLAFKCWRTKNKV